MIKKSRYRSRLAILVEILRVLCSDRRIPVSRICEYVNIPYDRLKPLLDRLETHGLIQLKNSGRVKTYIISEKGVKELYKLEKALEVLRVLELE